MPEFLKHLFSNRVKISVKTILWIPRNIAFLLKYGHLSDTKKIILALTPHARMANLGDHAQAVAINRWLSKYFPTYPVIEVDKEESRFLLPSISRLISHEDLIFLQSGGNLGERGKLTEPIRRMWISKFSKNQIISLPQTIYFSDTPNGSHEKEITSKIYSAHPRLKLIMRDRVSFKIAQELFPNASLGLTPDFCLFLDPMRGFQPRKKIEHYLVCLRDDPESIRVEGDRTWLANNLPGKVTFIDTMLERQIDRNKRSEVLREMLRIFENHDAIITDRLHGMIFGYLSRRPVVALPTADHKLVSAMDWFDEVSFMRLAHNIEDVLTLVNLANSKASKVPDWDKLYFSILADQIGSFTLKETPSRST